MSRHISASASLLAIFFMSLCMTINLDARKIKTKLPTKVTTVKSEDSIPQKRPSIIKIDSDEGFDGIRNLIRFYGFDKTVTSSKESFFVVNGLDNQISVMTVEITYFDMQGRQLHQALLSIDCDIPAGETRRVDIKTWDTQKAFYFHQSAKPRRQATPFDVTITLKSIEMISTENSVVD